MRLDRRCAASGAGARGGREGMTRASDVGSRVFWTRAGGRMARRVRAEAMRRTRSWVKMDVWICFES
jgi:hypothetical protein